MGNLDKLQKSLKNQKESILVDSKGTSIQYWCGVESIGGDHAGMFTGSTILGSTYDSGDIKDRTDNPNPRPRELASL